MRGFTLLELIVTVTVIGILLAIAVPSFRTMILNARRTDVTRNLTVAMTLARSESLKRNLSVRVCAAPNAAALGTASCTAGSDWKFGWSVQVNDPTAGWSVLRVFEAPPQGTTVLGTGSVSFTSTARSMVGGTVHVCDTRGASEGREVIVSPTARVHVESESVTCS